MSLELILWFVAWILLSEIIFIIYYLLDCYNWLSAKFSSFLIGSAIILIHLLIGLPLEPGSPCSGFECIDYSRYIYEALFIIFAAVLLGLNKLLTMFIDKYVRNKLK